MAKQFYYSMLDDGSLLKKLLNSEKNKEELWAEFVRRFSKLLLKVIWQFERDKDEVMEKYLWIFTRLADNDFSILRKFNYSQGKNIPKFSTWFVAVVRNLCIDAHRSVHGRKRFPKALLNLSEDDRKVFELYFWKGNSIEEIEHKMGQNHNDEHNFVTASIERIENLLHRSRDSIRLDNKGYITISTEEFSNEIAAQEEEFDELESLSESWLNMLPAQERLVLRLRFWEDLSVKEISKVMNIIPEQKIYAMIQKNLKQLRRLAERDYPK